MIRYQALLLCLLTACAASSGGVHGDSGVLAITPTGTELGSQISSIVLGTSERSGCRVVRLNLCNDTEDSIRFAWAIEWMDKAGATCPGTPAEWRTTQLGAGKAAPVEIVAPSPQAASWRLLAVDVAN